MVFSGQYLYKSPGAAVCLHSYAVTGTWGNTILAKSASCPARHHALGSLHSIEAAQTFYNKSFKLHIPHQLVIAYCSAAGASAVIISTAAATAVRVVAATVIAWRDKVDGLGYGRFFGVVVEGQIHIVIAV